MVSECVQWQVKCLGAVYKDGTPSGEYCINTSGQFYWWEKCCAWKYIPTCVPKEHIDATKRLIQGLTLLTVIFDFARMQIQKAVKT